MMPSDELQSRIDRLKWRVMEPFAQYLLGSMAIQPEIHAHTPVAREAERIARKRRESRFPSSWHWAADVVRVLLLLPCLGAAVAIAYVSRWFNEQ